MFIYLSYQNPGSAPEEGGGKEGEGGGRRGGGRRERGGKKGGRGKEENFACAREEGDEGAGGGEVPGKGAGGGRGPPVHPLIYEIKDNFNFQVHHKLSTPDK